MEQFVIDWVFNSLGVSANEGCWHETISQGESWFPDRALMIRGNSKSKPKEVFIKRGLCCQRINGQCRYPNQTTGTYNNTNEQLWNEDGNFTRFVAIKFPESANMNINILRQQLETSIEANSQFQRMSYNISVGILGWRNNAKEFVIVKYS